MRDPLTFLNILVLIVVDEPKIEQAAWRPCRPGRSAQAQAQGVAGCPCRCPCIQCVYDNYLRGGASIVCLLEHGPGQKVHTPPSPSHACSRAAAGRSRCRTRPTAWWWDPCPCTSNCCLEMILRLLCTLALLLARGAAAQATEAAVADLVDFLPSFGRDGSLENGTKPLTVYSGQVRECATCGNLLSTGATRPTVTSDGCSCAIAKPRRCPEEYLWRCRRRQRPAAPVLVSPLGAMPVCRPSLHAGPIT